MVNRLQKFIYFFSAISPMLIVIAIVWLIKNSVWTKPISVSWKIPLMLIVIAVVSIIIFNLSFNYGTKHLQTIQVTGTGYSSGDGWIVAYVIAYLLPLASLEFGVYIFPVVVLIVVVLFIALTFTDYVTPHPWLYLRRYHFYSFDVEGAAAGYNLISCKRIRNPNDVKKVAQVFEFLLIREE